MSKYFTSVYKNYLDKIELEKIVKETGIAHEIIATLDVLDKAISITSKTQIR